MAENLPAGNFPPTRYSIVLAAQSQDPVARARALETIAASYWKPIYKYSRMKWDMTADDAADFTQEFFARLLEKEFLDSYDSGKGHLRTFLRTCADRLFLKQTRDSKRIKRGSGSPHLSLDFNEAEQELSAVSNSDSPEDLFDKEWVRSLYTQAIQRLRAHCEAEQKTIHFQLFSRCDLDEAGPKPSYAQLAGEFRLASTDVTNYLALARREFRRCVLDQLREMTASEDEFRREARSLLGMDIK